MNNLSFPNQKDTEQELVLSSLSSTNKSQKKIRILIAEDQNSCQKILQSYLEQESDLEIIGIAIDGQVAVELVEILQPDVVLMNLKMPTMDGLAATEIITHRYVDTKVLILSISDNVEYIKKSFQIGAKGYFLKNSQPQELVTAIRNIALGYYHLRSGLFNKLDSDTFSILNQHSDQAFSSENLSGLNEHGFEVINTKKLIKESEKIDLEQADETFSDSDYVLAERKSKKLYARSFRLLLSGILIFLLIPMSRKWWTKLPILSTVQSKVSATAQESISTTILPVKTVMVDLVNSYQVDRTYTGKIVSRRHSSLGFERGGKLLNLTVDLGEQVKAGTPLAILNTKNLKAKQKELFAKRKQVKAQLQELVVGSRSETIASEQSTVKTLQFQVELSQIKGQRRQELYSSGAISLEQLDEANTEVESLQALLNKAQSKLDELLAGTRPEKIAAQRALLEQLDAQLASLEVELEQSILNAPFSGRIAERLVDEGTVVSAGESIFTLVEASSLEVHVGVPINAATQIPIGSRQQLEIGSGIYQAQVLSTLPQLDPETLTLTVVLRLDGLAATKVRAGQIARLKLSETIADSGYWLPTTALVRGIRGLWSCYVLDNPDNIANAPKTTFRVKQRELEVLQTESERVFVRGTLQNNDRVIVNGNRRLVNGQLVRSLTVQQ